MAFTPADEEQVRKTLHSHWQIWLALLSHFLHHDLFSQSPIFRKRARDKFFKLINNFMHSSYDPDFDVTHRCIQDCPGSTRTQTSAQQRSNCHFEDCDLQVFRNARHKSPSKDIQRRVAKLRQCGKFVSTTDIVNTALETWRQYVLEAGSSIQVGIPLTEARLDIAVYRHSYDVDGGGVDESDAFWGNKDVRDTLLQLTFDEHESHHHSSCFKKGSKCSFFLPEPTQFKTDIYADHGEDNKKMVKWYRLVQGDALYMSPWMIQQRRPM